MNQIEYKPWETEPDNVMFEAYGFSCAMRRNHSGAWCGYVGVPESHPWFGYEYNTEVECAIPDTNTVDGVGIMNTFMSALKPDNDIGFNSIDLIIECHGGLTYSRKGDFPVPASPFWWFDFDCSHSGDLTPKYANTSYLGSGTYRTVDYVRNITTKVAEQLSRASGKNRDDTIKALRVEIATLKGVLKCGKCLTQTTPSVILAFCLRLSIRQSSWNRA